MDKSCRWKTTHVHPATIRDDPGFKPQRGRCLKWPLKCRNGPREVIPKANKHRANRRSIGPSITVWQFQLRETWQDSNSHGKRQTRATNRAIANGGKFIKALLLDNLQLRKIPANVFSMSVVRLLGRR
ncbi:hypothetical protein NPIL_674911 [Nephila pilipes]|uniref:Uncharacterized protein n=1 Tax=Nephila pilipes TaxID=299642 RepID=A0A8X6NA96_NEPPI|nr:hypothetical protein NPIL_674911 [Nephila pilipes]